MSNYDYKKFFLTIMWIALIIVSLGVTYYYVIALPNYNNQKLEFDKQKYENEQSKQIEKDKKAEEEKLANELEKEKNEEQLNSCIDEALKIYSNQWKSKCEQIKRDTPSFYSDDWKWWCLLSKIFADKYEESLRLDKDECYKRFQN